MPKYKLKGTIDGDIFIGEAKEIVDDAAIGYGAGTTGGGQAATVIASTLNELKAACANTQPLVIHVKGTITGGEMVSVKSNKTIAGLPGAVLDGVGLDIFGQPSNYIRNVLVRNLIFRNSPGDGIQNKYANTVWIDHCEFENAADGLLDVTRASDNLTVSYCKFKKSTRANLIGGGETVADLNKNRITWYGNLWERCNDRCPKVSGTQNHLFNNYWLDSFDSGSWKGAAVTVVGNEPYSQGAALNSVVRLDNNCFRNFAGIPVNTQSGTQIPGYVSGLETNKFENCGANKVTTPPSVWVPPYSYTPIPVDQVPEYVMKNAGAILS